MMDFRLSLSFSSSMFPYCLVAQVAALEARLAEQVTQTRQLAARHEFELKSRTVLDEQLLRALPLVHEANTIRCSTSTFYFCPSLAPFLFFASQLRLHTNVPLDLESFSS